MDAADIIERLRNRYDPPRWAGFSELRDATGFGASRSIDWFAINTYPSKGECYVAVEVKVSRGDFARELDNPNKRQLWESYCTETWFASPAGMIRPEEIPEGWGLLEAIGGGRIRAKVRAPQRASSKPDEHLWISIARRAAEASSRLAKHLEPYAEFAGKQVSVEDLRRLAKRLSHGNDAMFDLDVSQAAHRLRAEHIKNHRAYWDDRKEVVVEAERLARAVDRSLSFKSNPTEVARILRTIRSVSYPPGIVKALRDAADVIEGGDGRNASAGLAGITEGC